MLLLAGAKVSVYSIGEGDVIFAFKWNEIFFVLKENFHERGGYVSFDPRTLPDPISFWGMLSTFSGAFFALNYLAFILWGWVRLAGYGIGLFHFYAVVYAKTKRCIVYILCPPLFFDRLEALSKDPLPEGKRVSFWVFLSVHVRTKWWFYIPFLWVLVQGLFQMSNWLPIGSADGAHFLHHFLSLFSSSITMVSTLYIGMGLMIGFVLFVIPFWMIVTAKRFSIYLR